MHATTDGMDFILVTWLDCCNVFGGEGVNWCFVTCSNIVPNIFVFTAVCAAAFRVKTRGKDGHMEGFSHSLFHSCLSQLSSD